MSSSACAWGEVVGDVVARSDVHVGIALARPRGLLDCWWSWVLRRGLSREVIACVCSVSASASVVVGYGDSGIFASVALLGDAMRAGGELEVGG